MPGTGTVELDFGAFPGKSDASVAVTGQGTILSGSLVEAWLFPVATADHTADEHMLETLKVFAGNVVAGTGFTVYGFNSSQLNEPGFPQFLEQGQPLTGAARGSRHPATYSEGQGTRIYGRFTCAWAWA